MNKKAIEALIKCGAFGSTGASRAGACSRCSSPPRRPARRRSWTRRSARARSSTSAASAATTTAPRRRSPARPTRRSRSRSSSKAELLAAEKESIGIFISEHPLKRVRDALRVKGDTTLHRGARTPRRRVGQGRRHDRRGQEDQHPLGLDGDVRDPRRPRRPGRAARLREGHPRQRGRRCSRTRSSWSAAAWTKGENGKICVKVADVSRVRPVRRRDRAGQGPGRGAGGRPRPAPAARCASTPSASRPRSSTSSSGSFERLPGRVRGRARGPYELPACAGCASASSTASNGRDAALRAELRTVLGDAVVTAEPQPA